MNTRMFSSSGTTPCLSKAIVPVHTWQQCLGALETLCKLVTAFLPSVTLSHTMATAASGVRFPVMEEAGPCCMSTIHLDIRPCDALVQVFARFLSDRVPQTFNALVRKSSSDRGTARSSSPGRLLLRSLYSRSDQRFFILVLSKCRFPSEVALAVPC